ncbi:MAG: FGGY-family carbohydrate kinase, partial [Acidobacteriaceae bacterium]
GDAAQLNFTNEGGVGGRFCFLRNVNGLWLLMQCMEAWEAAGERHSLESLIEAAAELPAPKILLDVDDPDLLAPGDMPEKIATQLERKKAASAEIRKSRPAMVGLILHSLAARYARVLADARVLTGIEFDRLYVVGGGGRNLLLNRLTEQATGLPLIVGAPESSTIGNFSVQLAALEQIQNDGVRQNGVEHDAVARWAAVLCSPLSNSPVPAAARPVYTTQSVGKEDL